MAKQLPNVAVLSDEDLHRLRDAVDDELQHRLQHRRRLQDTPLRRDDDYGPAAGRL